MTARRALRNSAHAALFACLCSLSLLTRAQAPYSPAAVRTQRARELAREVERQLGRLPCVRQALVRVQLPDPLATPLDEPAARPRVHVALQHACADGDASPSPTLLRKTVRAAEGELHESDVEIHSRAAEVANAPRMVSVGPFQTSADSAPWLRAALLGLLLSTLMLSLLVLRLLHQRRAPH